MPDRDKDVLNPSSRPCKDIDESTIQEIHLLRPKPILYRWDVTPFLILYAIALSIHYNAEVEWWSLFGLIAMPIIFFFHMFVALLGYWSIPLRMKIAYYPVSLVELSNFMTRKDSKVSQMEQLKKSMEIVKNKYLSALTTHKFYETLHSKQVEVLQNNYNKQMATWKPESGRVKPSLKLPVAPEKPTISLPPVTIGDDIISIAIIPVTNYGSPVVCELGWDVDSTVSGAAKARYDPAVDSVVIKPGTLPPVFFRHHYYKYTLDLELNSFISQRYPDNKALKEYINAPSLSSSTATRLISAFGHNTLTVPIPSFITLFIENAMAPFFVFQVMSIALWMLDEYWYYSLFTLVMIVMLECMTVYKRSSNLKEMLGPKPPLPPIFVYRDNTWVSSPCNEIVPGDTISIPMDISAGTEGTTVCCDVVITDGSCVVDEAILTGESVPQVKTFLGQITEGIDECDGDSVLSTNLDANNHKKHMLFAGTKILNVKFPATDRVLTPSPAPNSSVDDIDDDVNTKPKSKAVVSSQVRPAPPSSSVVGVVTRTSFGTVQGSLVRTILTSSNTGAADKEALMFILILLVVAIIAAYHVLVEGLKDPNRSRYKLLLNVIMIITSVVPPDLPMQLSMSVNNAVMALSKVKLFVTEPFRIPLGGAVDVACFDKTGTLTADSFNISSVASTDEELESCSDFMSVQLSPLSAFVLSTCHELTPLTSNEASTVVEEIDASENSDKKKKKKDESGDKDKLIGDPMESAAFQATGSFFTNAYKGKDHIIIPNNRTSSTTAISGVLTTAQHSSLGVAAALGAGPGAIDSIIHHVFPFSSANRRMSSIVATKTPLPFSLPSTASNPNTHLCVVAKGAPEMLYDFMSPSHRPDRDVYTTACTKLAKQGLRVIALAYRPLYMASKTDHTLVGAETPDCVPVTWSYYEKNHKQLHISQKNAEENLHFAGIIALSSPAKRDSAKVVAQLQEAGIKVMMITGDHLLTATSVAAQLKITHKPVLVLDTEGGDSDEDSPKSLVLRDGDDNIVGNFDHKNIDTSYDYATTGSALKTLTEKITALSAPSSGSSSASGDSNNATSLLGELFVHFSIFSRTSPSDKEHIIRCLSAAGNVCVMCGDGTNDVGALRQAHIGVALLSKDKYDENEDIDSEMDQASMEMALMEKTALSNVSVATMLKQIKEMKKKKQDKGVKYTMLYNQTLMMCENGDENLLKPGDASIAAPFTAKHSSVRCVVDLLKQGRVALVTTMQMYQILAVTCLISAYHMSALFLKGVKSGEVQMTLQGLMTVFCFFMISRAEPMEKLHPERPYARIFSTWMILTVSLQFLVHFVVLYLASSMAEPYIDNTTVSGLISLDYDFADVIVNPDGTVTKVNITESFDEDLLDGFYSTETPSPTNKHMKYPPIGADGTVTIEDFADDAKFASNSTNTNSTDSASEPAVKPKSTSFVPNVLNTTLFLIQTAMTASTFLANYRGWPFMTPLQNHSSLYKMLLATVVFCVVCSLEIIPELNEALEFVPLPSPEYSFQLCLLVVVDVVLATLIGQGLMRVFALKPKHAILRAQEMNKAVADKKNQ